MHLIAEFQPGTRTYVFRYGDESLEARGVTDATGQIYRKWGGLVAQQIPQAISAAILSR